MRDKKIGNYIVNIEAREMPRELTNRLEIDQ